MMRRDVESLQNPLLKFASHKMTIELNVYSLFMKNRVSRDMKSCCVVTKSIAGWVCEIRKSCRRALDHHNFTSSSSYGSVFRFCWGPRGCMLFFDFQEIKRSLKKTQKQMIDRRVNACCPTRVWESFEMKGRINRKEEALSRSSFDISKNIVSIIQVWFARGILQLT